MAAGAAGMQPAPPGVAGPGELTQQEEQEEWGEAGQPPLLPGGDAAA